MKLKILASTALSFAFFSCSTVAHAQTNPFFVTNFVTITNPPPLITTNTTVTTNAPVLPPLLVNEIATSLGIPPILLSIFPVKLIPWLFGFVLLLPYIGRAWHALATKGGIKGIWNAVVMGTNVPVPMEVQKTKEPVVAAQTNTPNPPTT